MKRQRLLGSLAFSAFLASCAMPPTTKLLPTDAQPDQETYPNGHHYRVQATGDLNIMNVAVDSQSSSFPASNIKDGDPSSQWVNGGYRNATSWASLDFGSSSTVGSVRIKTGISPSGTSYDIQVSNNGSSWQTVLSNQKNTTWGMETKSLPSGTSGRYLRIFWHNSSSFPQAHFGIFEVAASGTSSGGGGGGGPTPTPAPTATPGNAAQFYPDMQAVPASDLWVEQSWNDARLHLTNTIQNGGPGDLQVIGTVVGNQTLATQQIVNYAGNVVTTKSVGYFAYHPSHHHFHIDAVASYELHQGSPSGPLLSQGDKVSFCLLDVLRFMSGGIASRFVTCTPTIQGITRTWEDVYTGDLPGQDISIQGVTPGQYYLVTVVDPTNKFLDADRSNNMAWVKIYLDPNAGSVQVLASSN